MWEGGVGYCVTAIQVMTIFVSNPIEIWCLLLSFISPQCCASLNLVSCVTQDEPLFFVGLDYTTSCIHKADAYYFKR